jgi:hypothetical protein
LMTLEFFEPNSSAVPSQQMTMFLGTGVG